jgi:hypothetical protein
MPLFSVIIPTYNRAALLREALDTVFAQTFTDYEVIVVDDGSTDETTSVVSRYGGRIRFFKQQNQGPGAARNLGIANARGKYIAFLDSDDIWCPWTLQVYQRVIAEHGEPFFIAGRSLPLRGASQPTASDKCPPLEAEWFANFLEASKEASAFAGTPGLAVRTDIVREAAGFAGSFINGEDQDFCLRLGVVPGFVQIENPPVFLHRTHPGHVSGDVRRTIDGVRLLMQRERDGFYPGGRGYCWTRRKLICAAVRSVSLACAQGGKIPDGVRLYLSAIWWQICLGRWKYVLGFPIMALLHMAKFRTQNAGNNIQEDRVL